ncbi:unnamed protein product [Pneumocystis jirovecii]|uniref:BAH domain-containing protein n=2 Tax=Pneumocystis jirovecii TaxID=42068 RepID=L0PE46_PNEJI|nr:uncharacterized protein T551_03337 [Pneumocystis jirovecii RU7]KTW26875.1 hypothetical protein T551_03337 [Pneumocystis jirovecii RU7]CCJ30359.1 unnamed protein product [Pneumocystis jirovecii]
MISESLGLFLNPDEKFTDKIEDISIDIQNKKRKFDLMNPTYENTVEQDIDKGDVFKSNTKYLKYSKDQKKAASQEEEKQSLITKENQTSFAIGPNWRPAGWFKMNKYKSLKLQDEKFYVGDYVFINNSEEKLSDNFDFSRFWIAKLLEIRAENGQNVWVMCQWYYKPEELPEGRKYYHGEMELIESDYHEIIAANTISSKVIVKYWDEEKEFEFNDENEKSENTENKLSLDTLDDIPEFYWRQRFGGDSTNPKLTRLTALCKCKKYHNPDKILYACYNCKNWLHDECLRKNLIKSGAPNDIELINKENQPLLAKSRSTLKEYEMKCLLCESVLI